MVAAQTGRAHGSHLRHLTPRGRPISQTCVAGQGVLAVASLAGVPLVPLCVGAATIVLC